MANIAADEGAGAARPALAALREEARKAVRTITVRSLIAPAIREAGGRIGASEAQIAQILAEHRAGQLPVTLPLTREDYAAVLDNAQSGGVMPSSQGDAEVIAESIEPRAPVPSGGFVRREGEAPINQMVSFIREGRQRAGIATGADRRAAAAVASERQEERRRQLAAERAAREEQRREAAGARAERAAKRARRD